MTGEPEPMWSRIERRAQRRRIEALERHRAKLETVLAIVASVAVAGRGCSALDLLAVVEELIDRAERDRDLEHERFLDLLRGTA